VTNTKRRPQRSQNDPKLYRELVGWYRLVDPPDDHQEEAAAYQAGFERAVSPRPETLLDLGAGAGHNAFHLKRRFRCTLTDRSKEMLKLSRELNPECEHIAGDMRTLRLGRTFDAVLVHDAVMYMTTEKDLLAAARTALAHTRPGGAAIFAPDFVRETFREKTDLLAEDEGKRALRGMEWVWDPDPADETCATEYVFLLRENGRMTVVHDHHVEGLFPRATWLHVLQTAGYSVELMKRPLDDSTVDEIFLCRRS
jgi:trans-aconitate methyltransferase